MTATRDQDNKLSKPHHPGMIPMFRGWSTKKKLVLLLIILIVAAILIILTRLYRFSDYRLLYGHLNAKDLTSVSRWLVDHDIDHKIDKKSRSVYLPADRIHQSRIGLAEQQVLPNSENGLDLLGSGILKSSDYPGNHPYILAVQRELATTISAFDQIHSARVQLDLGTDNYRINKKPNATAVLNIIPGRELSSDQIKGIVKLIAASVPGMQPTHIKLFDSSGMLIPTHDWLDGDNLFPADSFAYKKYIEHNFENKAQEIVDALLGSGQALVKVSALLDLTKTETVSERYDPEDTVVRREHIQQEPSSPASSPSGTEATGVSQSVDRYRPPVITSSEVDYEINKTINTTVEPTARVDRLAVTVLITQRSQRNNEQITSFSPRGENELNLIKESLTAALPLQPDRGDTIQVISIPAPRHDAALAVQTPSFLYDFLRYLPLLRIVLIILGLLLLYILVLRPLIALLGSDPAEPLSGEDDHRPPPPSDSEPVAAEEDATTVLQKRIISNPAAAAHVIKKWMQET